MPDRENRLEKIFTMLMPDETVPARQRTKVNCLRWDSLFQLNLILAMEQEFGVTVSDEEAIDMTSFEVALQVLNEKAARKVNSDG